MMTNYDITLTRALRWLQQSGVIDRKVGTPTFGAFYYGYSPLSRSRLQTYSEITGYGISLLVQLFQWSGDSLWLNLAINAARHLETAQLRKGKTQLKGGFSHGYLPEQQQFSPDYYSFDAAICVSGLADLYLVWQDDRVRKTLVAGADFLLQCQEEDGSFKARYNANQDDFVPVQDTQEWFGDYGTLHSKNAIGLLKAYKITSNEKYLNAAKKVLHWVKQLQLDSGCFRINPNSNRIYTHAHCYTIEAMMFAQETYPDIVSRLPSVIEMGINWLVMAQNSRGALYRWYPRQNRIGEWVTDATSQLTRILLCYDPEQFNERIGVLLPFLAASQIKDRSSKPRFGAFVSKYYDLGHLPVPSSKIMTWSSLFALHAFLLLRQSKTQLLKPSLLF